MSNVTVSMLLLEKPIQLGKLQLFENFLSQWPGTELPAITDSSDDIVMFETSNANGAISVMDMRIPDLLAPDKSGEPHPAIPEYAHEVVRKHRAHAIVTIVSGPMSSLERATCLTKWLTSIGPSCGALGVYWGDGPVVTPIKEFCEWAQELKDDSLPLMLWVFFSIGPNDDGSHSLLTSGLENLGGHDIEIEREAMPPVDMFSYAASFAHYTLSEGTLVADNDTFGFSETERIRVRHRPTGDGKSFVYCLEFGKRTQ